ncbi:MAG: patatin-like phospholipase family protein [Xanthomonadales bacterium]|nr:patatin-like phospholipase family protein [Xanthomonadales bacterium]
MSTSVSTRSRSGSSGPGAKEPKIGKEKEFVRALNFSGSAFDTVMQLGVAHALLVIQGRAPDIITGVSAGAIQAAAVAEILQAGEQAEIDKLKICDDEGAEPGKGSIRDRCREKWLQLSAEQQKEIQEIRLHARVARLREFAGAVQRAPEEVVDSLLPDAYQIDERGHLEPLMRPLDSSMERKARRDMLSGRAGLVTLYNELLSLPLTVGTVTRIVRRILGLKGTSEIRGVRARWFARAAEAVPLWVLIGRKLPKFSRVFRLGPKAYLVNIKRWVTDRASDLYEEARGKPSPWRDRGTDASTIISRFKTPGLIGGQITDLLAFLTLLIIWVAVSWTALFLPALIADVLHRLAALAGVSTTGFQTSLFYASGYILLAVLLVLNQSLLTLLFHEPISLFKAGAMVGAFLGLTIFWTAVLLALTASVSLLIDPTLAIYSVRGVAVMLPTWLDPAIAEPEPLKWAWGGAGIVLTVVVLVWLARGFPRAFLKAHDLDKALFQSHPLEMVLAELFDPEFYGRPDMRAVVERSLNDEQTASDKPTKNRLDKTRRKVGWYSDDQRLEPISLGLAVANMSTRKVHEVAPDESIVEALLTATAMTPLFPARKLKPCPASGEGDRDPCQGWYIDAARLISQPTRVLFNMLRNKHPESEALHMYNVAPIPLSREELGEEPGQEGAQPYLNLIDVVLRAMSLQQFRDAQLEQRLTERYTRSIPSEEPNVVLRGDRGSGEEDRRIFRAWVTPVESDVPLKLNRRIMLAGKQDRRQAIMQTIADGCRASLEVMVRGSLPGSWKGEVRCDVAVKIHLNKRAKRGGVNGLLTSISLPGCKRDPLKGPGLPEICRHCRLNSAKEGAEINQRLRLRPFARIGPAWPHERETMPDIEKDDPHFETEQDRERLEPLFGGNSNSPARNTETQRPQWPSGKDPGKPTVSFLFSGGVFRGVYQMGVVNALSMVGLQPNLIAGASVGSITAAMVARVFSEQDANARQHKIAELASVYLALDRIMLTDRFSDFVRELTIRAAQTNFSINDADHLFRKYDHHNSIRFTRRARNVIAGIERLFYVNPFQLRKLAAASRNRDYTALKQVQSYVQQWLDRMQVGKQLLGAEPLSLLIDHYVLASAERDVKPAPTPVPIDTFVDWPDPDEPDPDEPDHRQREENQDEEEQDQEAPSIAFLATATNLTAGRLEVLGEDQLETNDLAWQRPILRESLLASSAFPGVFRPRWSWELRPTSCDEAQYIDGGTIDNLPIQPTVDFLSEAAAADRIQFRPAAAGHLILAASLRSDPKATSAGGATKLEQYWPALNRRAGRLKYNKKIDTYGKAAKDLRRIWEEFKGYKSANKDDGRAKLLDIEVVTIKPNWTCGTFGFHPMLGFRRKNQARSIAHGCATTLIKMAELGEDRLGAWGKINPDALPTDDHKGGFPKKGQWKSIRRTDGQCWLNIETQCPFSEQALHGRLEKKTVTELNRIYKRCQKRNAHFT